MLLERKEIKWKYPTLCGKLEKNKNLHITIEIIKVEKNDKILCS
jgi:hypothetical protein